MKKTFFVFIFSCCMLLTFAQNPIEFWGATVIGGSGLGTFFKTDSNGDNLIVTDSLSGNKGKEPSGTLTLGTNGKIYAVTSWGGAYNSGTLICKSIPYETVSDTIITVCEDSTFAIKSGVTQNGYTFQWYKDEKPIVTATSENLDFLSSKLADAGVYFCKVSNGCRVIQTQQITLNVKILKDCSVGISERDANPLFSIYPNPATDLVTIQMKNSVVNNVAIELIDLVGRSVYTEDIVHVNSGNSFLISIANLTKGLYMLKMTNLQTNSVGYEKLIKK